MASANTISNAKWAVKPSRNAASRSREENDIIFGEVFENDIPNLISTPIEPKELQFDIDSNSDSEFTDDKSYRPNALKTRVKQIDNSVDSNQMNSTSKQTEPKPEENENYQLFQKSLQFIQYFGDFLGLAMSFDWKISGGYIFSTVLLVFMICLLTYTQVLHIQNHNYFKILETLACYGITISMMLKHYLYFTFYKGWPAMFNFTIKLCKINSTGHRAIRIRDRLLYNLNFYKWTAFFIAFSLCIFVVYPIKAFIVDNELISLLPIEVMFVDQSTLSGFVIANIIMSFFGVFAVVATAYCILIIAAGILNYSVFADLLEEDIKALDEMWSGTSDTTVWYRRCFIRNMFRKQLDMEAYIGEIQKYLNTYIFCYFCSSYLGQILCLFQIVVSDWKSGYAIAYAMFIELMFYCYIGTKLKYENERVLYALQQSNWYSYDVHSQKTFLMLWIATTNVKELWIGTLAPLTVVTGTQIIKSIYTYYNIMLEFV